MRASSLDPKENTASPQGLLNLPLLAPQYARAMTPETPANAARMPPTMPLFPTPIDLSCVGEREIEGAAVGVDVGEDEGWGDLEGAALGEAVGLALRKKKREIIAKCRGEILE